VGSTADPASGDVTAPRVRRTGVNRLAQTRRPVLAAAAAVAGVAFGVPLAALAAVRRSKAVHPHGAVYTARLEVSGTAAAPDQARLLATPGSHSALVRFSRSLGLPRRLPDLLGMSIRVLSAYGTGRDQDFLLVSSVDLPVLHQFFVPASDFQQRPYTSSLPYRAGTKRFIVGALPHPDSPSAAGETDLDRVRSAAATGRLRFHVAVAAPMGRFQPVAELHIGDPLPPHADALRFSPFNADHSLRPVGLLNDMRRYAYPMSQAAWRRTHPDGPRIQESADQLGRSTIPVTNTSAAGKADKRDALALKRRSGEARP
jgi:hypothetical protein